jgi:hypothetical protein
MSTKTQQVGLIFSQNDDLTKLAIVLPTQDVKKIVHWIIPVIGSSLIWFSGVLPTAPSQPHHPAQPSTEQPKPAL